MPIQYTELGDGHVTLLLEGVNLAKAPILQAKSAFSPPIRVNLLGSLRLTILFVVLVLPFVHSSTSWSGGKGEIGLGLKREGLAWRVVRISRDGQAAKAGLKVGDVVVQINNLFLPSEEQLNATVAGLKPGDVVEVSVLNRFGGFVLHKISAATASK